MSVAYPSKDMLRYYHKYILYKPLGDDFEGNAQLLMRADRLLCLSDFDDISSICFHHPFDELY